MPPREDVRSSGYVSRIQELGYELANPFYDLFVSWALLPLAGQRKLRAEVARWLRPQDGHAVPSRRALPAAG